MCWSYVLVLCVGACHWHQNARDIPEKNHFSSSLTIFQNSWHVFICKLMWRGQLILVFFC